MIQKKLFFSFAFLFLFINFALSVSAVATQFFPLPNLVDVEPGELYTFYPQYYFAGYNAQGIGVQFTNPDNGQSVFLNFNGIRTHSNSKFSVQVYSNGNIQFLAKSQEMSKKIFNIYVSSNPASTQLVKPLAYSITEPDEGEPSAPISPNRIQVPPNRDLSTNPNIFSLNNYYQNYDCARLRYIEPLNNITYTMDRCKGDGTFEHSSPSFNTTLIGNSDAVAFNFYKVTNISNQIYMFLTVYKEGQITSGLTDAFYLSIPIGTSLTPISSTNIPNQWSVVGYIDVIGFDYLCVDGVLMVVCNDNGFNNNSRLGSLGSYENVLNYTIWGEVENRTLTKINLNVVNDFDILADSENNINFEFYWNNSHPYYLVGGGFDVGRDLEYIIYINATNAVSLDQNAFRHTSYQSSYFDGPIESDFWGRQDINFEFRKFEFKQYVVSDFFDNYNSLGVALDGGVTNYIIIGTNVSYGGIDIDKDYAWQFYEDGNGSVFFDFLAGDVEFPFELVEFTANNSNGITLTLATFISVNGTFSNQSQDEEEVDELINGPSFIGVIVGYFSQVFPDKDTISIRIRFAYIFITLVLTDLLIIFALIKTGSMKFIGYVLVAIDTILIFYFIAVGYINIVFAIIGALILLAIGWAKFRG